MLAEQADRRPDLSLAIIILTYNEELHIARALDNVAGLTSQIFVVDSFSTDRTREIARERGVVVLENKFISHAKQFQWALDNVGTDAGWVMRLDADELLEADLITEIQDRLPKLPETVVGINLKRKHIFLDRWIRHGGRYPMLLMRLWRNGHGRVEDRWMDEHVVTWGGQTITFDGSFADHNLNDLTFFINKHNRYATLEAVEVLNQKLLFSERDAGMSSEASSRQAARKRFLKEKFFNRIPYEVAASLFFLYRYVIQLGFLDGRAGLAYHLLQGLWYRFLIGAKVRELEGAVAHLSSPVEIKAELSRKTGLALT